MTCSCIWCFEGEVRHFVSTLLSLTIFVATFYQEFKNEPLLISIHAIILIVYQYLKEVCALKNCHRLRFVIFQSDSKEFHLTLLRLSFFLQG